MPVLARTLGAAEYEVWVLTGTISSYVLLFDFGVPFSVSKFVAAPFPTLLTIVAASVAGLAIARSDVSALLRELARPTPGRHRVEVVRRTARSKESPVNRVQLV